jgi:hypothetical protein
VLNTVAPLLLVVCVVVAAAVAPDRTEACQPPSQSSLTMPPQVVAQPPVDPNTTGPRATTPDLASSSKSDTGSQTASPAASSVTDNGQVTSNKPGKKVLVDDTVNDAQLKQILAKGYKPDSQARGNQVYYCRGEQELGSRFEKKVCKTATRILQDELQGKDVTTRLERPSGNPAAK